MGGWPSGTHLVMETTKNTNKYYAIGYKYSSKKIISFISTSHAGHTNAGEPYVAKWVDRNNRQLRRDIPRPHLLSQLFTHSNQIDKHNHERQDLLGIEDNVVTQDGYFRLYCTYLGITVTDAWKFYRHHLGDKHKDKNISIMTFSNLLCKTLLVNDYKGAADETNTIPTLRVLEEPAPRHSLSFPNQLTVAPQNSTISTLGTGGTPGNLLEIGPGRYIPVSFLAPHDRARCQEQGDLIQAGQGALFSNVRKKRGRCRECSLNTKFQCSCCRYWLCEKNGKHGRDCFHTHVARCLKNERDAHWCSIQEN